MARPNPWGGTKTFAYDANGNLVLQTDANGTAISHAYNNLNWRTETTGPLGGVSVTSHDAAGNILSVTDANGNTTSYTYNENGWLVSVQNAIGGTIEYIHDPAGNLLSLKDENGGITQRTYDAMNRMLTETSPSGLVTSISYNAQGNKAQAIDPNGNTIHFEYDELHRRVSNTYADGSQVLRSFDLMGRVTELAHSGGLNDVITKSYDSRGSLISTSITHDGLPAQLVEYAYDEGGRLLSRTHPDGSSVQYQYDDDSRIVGILCSETGLTSFEYDLGGRRTGKQYPNGMFTNYVYDAASRLLSLHTVDPDGNTVSHFQYTYDGVGNRTSESDFSGMGPSYTYDALNRLTHVEGTFGESINYAYDGVGNRLSKEVDGVVSLYTYDQENRMLSAGEETFIYDNNGNLISVLSGRSELKSFLYDKRNKLIAAFSDGSFTSHYYTGLGDRIASFVESEGPGGGQSSYYLNDYSYFGSLPAHPKMEHLLFELAPDGTPLKSFVSGPGIDEHISMNTGDAVHYYIPDAIGSIRQMVDGSGNLSGMYTYDAFGTVLEYFEEIDNPYRFAGREYDKSTGLYYNRHRYYDSHSGRFTTKDPLGMVDGTNLYTYTVNNPATLTDPSGLSWLLDVPKLELGSSDFAFNFQIGSRGNNIIKWDGPITAARFPDFEFFIQIASRQRGQGEESYRNERIYKKGEICKVVKDRFQTTPMWIRNFELYLALYLRVNLQQQLIDQARNQAAQANRLADAASVTNAVTTVLSPVPIVGAAAGIVGGIAGGITSDMSTSQFNASLRNLENALQTARAEVRNYYLWHDSWRENLPSLIENRGPEIRSVYACPDKRYRVLPHRERFRDRGDGSLWDPIGPPLEDIPTTQGGRTRSLWDDILPPTPQPDFRPWGNHPPTPGYDIPPLEIGPDGRLVRPPGTGTGSTYDPPPPIRIPGTRYRPEPLYRNYMRPGAPGGGVTGGWPMDDILWDPFPPENLWPNGQFKDHFGGILWD